VARDERPSPRHGGARASVPAGGDADPLPQRCGAGQRNGATGASAPRPDGAVSPFLLLSLAWRHRNRASVCPCRHSLLGQFGASKIGSRASMVGSVCSPTGSGLVASSCSVRRRWMRHGDVLRRHGSSPCHALPCVASPLPPFPSLHMCVLQWRAARPFSSISCERIHPYGCVLPAD
jgi:hypothetical protein